MQRTENRLDGSGFKGTKLGDRSKMFRFDTQILNPSKRHKTTE